MMFKTFHGNHEWQHELTHACYRLCLECSSSITRHKRITRIQLEPGSKYPGFFYLYQFFNEMEMIVFVGIPASGKSSFYKERFLGLTCA